MKQKIRIAIFASGNGTNAENIIKYFTNHPTIEVHSLLCNKPDAKVLQRTAKYNLETKIFNREDLYDSNEIRSYLEWYEIDYIVLAGFLWMVPENLIGDFPDKIINIHPALLPRYGGKGMYGIKVHQAVLENKDRETGISIHLVNSNYDEGEIIFQAKVKVDLNDSVETLAKKIYELEQEHFPKVIEDFILNQVTNSPTP